VFGGYCNQTQQSIPTTSRKALLNANMRMTHEKWTCGFKVLEI
jgi:hypothetical protein